MENRYLEKFKKKSQDELKQIVDNPRDYQPDAIAAAAELLGLEEEVVAAAVEGPRKEYSEKAKPSATLDTSLYFRSFSYREVLTCFILILGFVLTNILVSYLGYKYLSINLSSYLFIPLLFLTLFANHVYYRIRHKRSNNFIGRAIGDAMFILMFSFLGILVAVAPFPGNSFSFQSGGSEIGTLIGMFLVLCMIVTVIEIIFEVLKFVLKKFNLEVI